MNTPSKSFVLPRNPVHFSTPCDDPNTTRPLPTFSEKGLFKFKRDRSLIHRSTAPQKSIKSATPVSRVFPPRGWAHDKAHAVSFRMDEHEIGNAFKSEYYDSENRKLYFEQCFVIEKKLGEGSFGEVVQVRCKENDEKFAVKRSREKFRHESDRKRKLDEVRKHELLPPHENCVKFIKAWEEENRLYIQTELCSQSLQSYIDQHHCLPEYLVWKYLLDLLQGLNHIHVNSFIHFDVKPANIFISQEGVCKIGDFGLVIDQKTDDINEAIEGDNRYMAPELLDGIFTEKADVFSLGISVLEIACDLDLPSGGESWQLLRQGFIPPECSEKLSQNLRDILLLLLTPDYRKRPTIKQVLDHPIAKSQARKIQPRVFAMKYFYKVLYYIHTLLFFFARAKNWVLRSDNHAANTEEKMWDSTVTDVTNISTFNTTGREFLNQSSFLTPVANRFSPTPRNSSPIVHNRAAIIRSPGVSPLSRTCFDFSSKNDISDESLSDDLAEINDRGFVLRPRNLLGQLNELSDSESDES